MNPIPFHPECGKALIVSPGGPWEVAFKCPRMPSLFLRKGESFGCVFQFSLAMVFPLLGFGARKEKGRRKEGGKERRKDTCISVQEILCIMREGFSAHVNFLCVKVSACKNSVCYSACEKMCACVCVCNPL